MISIAVSVPQAVILGAVAVTLSSGFMVIVSESVQLLPSLTSIVYVPELRPEKTLLVSKAPPLILYSKFPSPPELTVAVIVKPTKSS